MRERNGYFDGFCILGCVAFGVFIGTAPAAARGIWRIAEALTQLALVAP